MEDLGPDLDAENEEKEKERKAYAKRIEHESVRLRDSDFSEDSILHRSMQILYKRYGTNARLALKKIVESEDGLDELKVFMDGLDKDHEKLSHEMFLHIA